MCESILLVGIPMFFHPQPFEKHFWWGEWRLREGTLPVFPPWLPGAAFLGKVSLELLCTSFYPPANLHTEHLCEPKTEAGREHREGLSSQTS